MTSCKKNVTILVLTLTFIFSVTIADNDKLINQLCGYTFAPAVCISCIKTSTAAGPVQTDIDVLETVMSCTENDMAKVEESIIKILDDSTTDDATKKALFDCQPLIQAAVANGGTVLEDLAHRKFDQAKADIEILIIQNFDMCYSVLKREGVTLPPPVFATLFIAEGDYKMLYQIFVSLKQ